MFSRTPFLTACANVTGMVAAEDCVPSAVAYAGSIFFSNRNGFFPLTLPAMVNWISNNNTCRTNITMITFRNMAITLMTCPFTVMFKKIPKIWSGNKGMITASIKLTMIFWKSEKASRNAPPLI